jgi:hypothetical protein
MKREVIASMIATFTSWQFWLVFVLVAYAFWDAYVTHVISGVPIP